jgi:hypothetical protein
MRGSRTTSKLILAGALGLGSLVTLAAPALAGDVQPQEAVLVLPQGNPPLPGPGDLADAPQDPGPDPAPQPQPGPGDIADAPADPGPDVPLGPDDFADAPDGPGPQDGPDDKAPVPQDDPTPHDGPGDIADGGCHATHGCVPTDDCPGPLASCDLTDKPTDPGDDPTDGDEPEVQGDGGTRGALPHTGAGLAVLAAAGLGLVGAGTLARKAAARR